MKTETCDGCKNHVDHGQRLTRRGYIEGVWYCPLCAGEHERFEQARRDAAAEAGIQYRMVVAKIRREFDVTHPGFNLPDGDLD